MPEIDQTLAERGNRYGAFTGHASITQNLKRAMSQTDNWPLLADDQKEALEMIAHKIGRILNGDPNYHDSWHDIVGYTKLVADRILQNEKDKDNAFASLGQHIPTTAPSGPIRTPVSQGDIDGINAQLSRKFCDSGFAFRGPST